MRRGPAIGRRALRRPVANRSALITDAVIALVLAALVVIFAAGLAIVALIGLLLLVICGVVYLLDRRRGKSTARRGLRR